MAILGDLYRSRRLFSYRDNFGANAFINYYYSYLLFKDNTVFIFSSSPMFSSGSSQLTSFEDEKTLERIDIILKEASKSTVKKSGSKLEFNLQAQTLNDNGVAEAIIRLYEAYITHTQLSLKVWERNKNNEPIINEIFELVNLKR
jgi:hypothetical protein